MQIIVNGQSTTLPANTTVAELLEIMALTEKRLAMEVNEAIVPRSRFPDHYLQPGDSVEIVHAIGGG